MKKKIISVAVMMMAMAMMPVQKVAAAGTDDISLSGDQATSIAVTTGNVTLDLKGYNLNVSDAHAIIVSDGATLTITDTGRTDSQGKTVYGSVTARGNVYAAIVALPGATVDIESGVFKTENTTKTVNGKDIVIPAWYVVKNLGTMTINGGTFSNNTTGGSSVIDNGWYSGNTGDTINNTLYQPAENYTATLTINGGTVIGSYGAVGSGFSRACVKGDDCSTTIINGGTFSNATYPIQNNNHMTINGGTFSGAQAALVRNNNGTNLTLDAGELTINGGTYQGNETTDVLLANESGKTVIYNGIFNGSLSNTTGTMNTQITTIAVYGGTFKKTNGTTVYDVSAFVTGLTAFDTTTGIVSTNTMTKLTKYVFYTSDPSAVTFKYEISKADASKADDAVLSTESTSSSVLYEEIHNGVDIGNVTVNPGSLTYTVDDFNKGTSASDLALQGITGAIATRKYVAKDLTIDFSKVNFQNPGVYRYLLTETSNNIKVPASGSLYCDVWVERKSADPSKDAYKQYEVTAVVAHTTDSSAIYKSNNNKVGDKTTYLSSVSVQKAMNLTVKHYSLGNQASRTSDFQYKLTLENATEGATIAYKKSNGATGSFTLVSDGKGSGTASCDFTLKDHEGITFYSISEYPKYTVAITDSSVTADSMIPATMLESYQEASTSMIDDTIETSSAAKSAAYDSLTGETTTTGNDGVTTASGGTTLPVTGSLATGILDTDKQYTTVTDSLLTADTTVVFSVYKEGTIPTGVLVNVAPYAVVVLAGFFGLIVLAMKKKNKDEEEA